MEFEERLIKDVQFTNLYSSKPKYYLIKSIAILTILFLILFSPRLYLLLPQNDTIVCINDQLFNLTKPINKYLSNNTYIKNTFLIISSLFIDIMFFTLAYFWTVKGRSWRMAICFVIFYAFRSLSQHLFTMMFPSGYLISFPGFPSVIVSYLKASDFYPSGHVAFPLIAGLEFLYYLDVRNMFYFCMITSVFEAFVMIFVRGHYGIDILAGYIFAHYSYIIAEKYCYLLDDSCVSMNIKNKKIEVTVDDSINY